MVESPPPPRLRHRPGAGHLVADLVIGNAPIVDPADFRLSRFSDGSPIEIAPV